MPIDQNKDPSHRNRQMIKTVLSVDAFLFLLLALVCLLKPATVTEITGIDGQTATYLSYAFFALAISSLMAIRIITKERPKS